MRALLKHLIVRNRVDSSHFNLCFAKIVKSDVQCKSQLTYRTGATEKKQ